MMRKARVSGGKGVGTLYRVAGKAKGLRKMSGTSAASSADTAHSFSEEETLAFADWINYALAEDKDLKSKLPIDTETAQGAEALFSKVGEAEAIRACERKLGWGRLDSRRDLCPL